MAALAITGSSSISRGNDGTVEVSWRNGEVLNFVNGGTTDYVAPHFRMTVETDNDTTTYDMPEDISKMINGGVNAKLATIVGLLRKTVCSLNPCHINLTETVKAPNPATIGAITEADFKVLTDHPEAVQGIVKQAVTILALNGISLVTAGHHYRADDNVWNKLDSATNISNNFQTLGISNWEGTIYHDALHPFDIYWKAALVADLSGSIMPHINGVASKRIPATPAGCASVNVALAAAEAMAIIRPDIIPVLANVSRLFHALEAKYRADPLSWCAHFKSTRTAANLKYVAAAEDRVAFLYGMASILMERRATVMRSAAFKSVAGRHQGAVTQGKNFAENLEDVDVMTAAQAQEILDNPERYLEEIIALPVRDRAEVRDFGATIENDEDDIDDDGDDNGENPPEAPGNEVFDAAE